MEANTKANGHDALREGITRVLKHQDAGRLNDAGDLLQQLIETHGKAPILTHYLGINVRVSRDGGH